MVDILLFESNLGRLIASNATNRGQYCCTIFSITGTSMKRLFIFIVFASLVGNHGFGQVFKKEKMVQVNGIDMYYEVYGQGEPLLLLHGWTQSSAFWKDYIAAYAKSFKVYAIDLRGHGKTSPIANDFTIKKTADDLLEFINHLGLEKVKAIGLSYGGLALLELTGSHAKKVESMILIGVSQKYNGAENAKMKETFSYENLPKSFIDELRKIHHHGDHQIRALFDENLNYQINLSDQKVKAITSKALLVQGDGDEVLGIDAAIKLDHNLPHSELWIVPNAGHLAITGSNKNGFITKSLQFLNSED